MILRVARIDPLRNGNEKVVQFVISRDYEEKVAMCIHESELFFIRGISC